MDRYKRQRWKKCDHGISSVVFFSSERQKENRRREKVGPKTQSTIKNLSAKRFYNCRLASKPKLNNKETKTDEKLPNQINLLSKDQNVTHSRAILSSIYCSIGTK